MHKAVVQSHSSMKLEPAPPAGVLDTFGFETFVATAFAAWLSKLHSFDVKFNVSDFQF